MNAFDIAKPVKPIRAEAPGGEAVARFKNTPDLHILPIVADGRPVGVLSREGLLQNLSHRFGRDLWERRPVSQMMNAQPILIFAGLPLERVGDAVAGLGSEELRDGVVFIDAEGLYVGVASSFDLFQAAVKIAEARNSELRELAQRLAAETDKANAASQAKSDFLATMSHEIRTPLNGVLGMAQALALDDLKPAQRDKVGVILSSGETLTALLNDILDLSKIEAGKMDIAPVPSDLSKTVERVRRLFAPIAADKGVALETLRQVDGAAPLLPAWLTYDRVRVYQCLSNLVSNAVKFTATGRVSIDWRIEPATKTGEETGRHRVVIAVSDTGIGMDAATLGRLFNAFTQGDGSTTRRFGGTGLGLAITRRLAQIMGGDVSVVSQAGAGSTFTLSFFAQEARPRTDAAEGVPAAAAAVTHRVRPLSILLVDDNPTNRQVARLFLADQLARIVEADNGRAALARLSEETFDVVLLDVHMPIMDGCETIRRIRASDQGWSGVPVIALTADAMEGDRERFVAMGMTDYIAKPLDRRQLIAKVHAVTSRAVDDIAKPVSPPAPARTVATPSPDASLEDLLAGISQDAA